MDARIFRDEPMGLKGDLLTIPLEERLIDDAKDKYFVNFENLYIRSRRRNRKGSET